jgi:hypothetical protein
MLPAARLLHWNTVAGTTQPGLLLMQKCTSALSIRLKCYRFIGIGPLKGGF